LKNSRDITANPSLWVTIKDAKGTILHQSSIALPPNPYPSTATLSWYSDSTLWLMLLGIILVAVASAVMAMLKLRKQKKNTMISNGAMVVAMIGIFSLLSVIVIHITPTVYAIGFNNGITVFTPSSSSDFHNLQGGQYSGSVGSQTVSASGYTIELFINSPIHHASAGTYAKNSVPVSFKVVYAACENRVSAARVIIRYDANGGQQSTVSGSNANWVTLASPLYCFEPTNGSNSPAVGSSGCPGGSYNSGACPGGATDCF